MLSQSRIDALLDVLDEVYGELLENGYYELARKTTVLQQEITAEAERVANNRNPFVE